MLPAVLSSHYCFTIIFCNCCGKGIIVRILLKFLENSPKKFSHVYRKNISQYFIEYFLQEFLWSIPSNYIPFHGILWKFFLSSSSLRDSPQEFHMALFLKFLKRFCRKFFQGWLHKFMLVFFHEEISNISEGEILSDFFRSF